MDFLKVNMLRLYILMSLSILVMPAIAQEAESENARTALKTGSSKELVNMLHKSSELVLFDKKYNKDKAGPVLKDFFAGNPAVDFKFIHKGSSKDGSLSYSIGHYETKDSRYRVVIRFKKEEEEYKIHKIEVSNL